MDEMILKIERKLHLLHLIFPSKFKCIYIFLIYRHVFFVVVVVIYKHLKDGYHKLRLFKV
jgi:hypothetical protein